MSIFEPKNNQNLKKISKEKVIMIFFPLYNKNKRLVKENQYSLGNLLEYKSWGIAYFSSYNWKLLSQIADT